MAPVLIRSTLACCLLLPLMFGLTVVAQSDLKHFSQDGISFDYPDGWVMSDRSRPEAQHLLLTRPENSTLMMVVALREPIRTNAQLLSATQQVTEPYVRDLVTKLSSAQSPAARTPTCEKIGNATIGGVLIHGEMNGAPATAEVYAFPWGGRLINLVYIRKNAEEAQSSATWKLVRDSLKVDVGDSARVDNSEVDSHDSNAGIYFGGVLNGKALSLPRPDFPSGDRAYGSVIVTVTIDETGKVIGAHAMSGPIPLRSTSEQAAKKARFTPTTLCGKPVKVNGSIVYNFLPR